MSGKIIAIGIDSGFNSKAELQISKLFATALELDPAARLFVLRAQHSDRPLPCAGQGYTLLAADFHGDYPPDIAAELIDLSLPRDEAAWLFGPGSASRATAAHFAARRALPCAANVEALEQSEGGGFKIKRLAYAGNLSAELALPENAVFALNAAALGAAAAAGTGKAADIINLSAAQAPVELTVSRDEGGNPLAKARSLICVGRGLDSRAKLPQLQALAEKLGAELAASRPVVTSGWLPTGRLLGISGQSLAPEQCLLLGISGSRAFLYGISGAKTVFAVNPDRDAPIFSAADFGSVCTLEELCKLLEQKLNELN